MKSFRLTKTTSHHRWRIWVLVVICCLISLTTLLLLDTKTSVFTASTVTNATPMSLPPFPLGVDPEEKSITEDPFVEEYMATHIATNHTAPAIGDSWFDRAIARLATLSWYQNLATPTTRILVIQSGERQEEVSRNFARILGWSPTETKLFIDTIAAESPTLKEGKLYPGRYIVASDASPETVAIAVADRFTAEVRLRYEDAIADKVPLETALIIASLIEREAYDFNDMRYISGVIWNRLFIDMKLQIDATLQYARGTQSILENGRWWHAPTPADKFIDSPYNTYKHTGLPPAPIANPSIEAIVAALNPRETDCLFYYHTDEGTFYCNTSYEDHVAGVAEHLQAD